MNKTLLLIIIDFLFLNLIALTQWDKLEVSRPPAPVGVTVAEDPGDTPTPQEEDLIAAMKQSLVAESSRRESLAAKLASTESVLIQREQNLSQIEAEKMRLQTVLSDTRENADQMQRQLVEALEDSTVNKAQMERLRRELEAKRAEAEKQQAEIVALEKAKAEARQKIEGLSVAVRVAEQEKLLLKETAETFKQQAQAERVEREKVQATTVKLAQGVGQLAEKSVELTREIRDNRPVNANVIFNDFLANRVDTFFTAYRKTFLGPVARDRDARTIFVTDGAQVYALLHMSETPFAIRESGVDWERLRVRFSAASGYQSEVGRIDFLSVDPRIVVLPVDATQVAALGVKVYRTAIDPFKFTEAVLINGGGAGYGEVTFKLDASQPGYVQVDNRLMKRLFGDFAPSKGDLVMSKTGELLGIMVNSDYCVLVNMFTVLRSINTGDDIKAQETGIVLDALTSRYRNLPVKLQ